MNAILLEEITVILYSCIKNKLYGKDSEKMIPPVRIHGRKWNVEAWSMFKEIRDERAFNGILNQIIENIQNGSLKAGATLPAERTMAETMGVSRPAVREALRALELLGIINLCIGTCIIKYIQ